MNMVISESEKQRILELHNNFKSTINEQNAAYAAGQKIGGQAAKATKQAIKGVANDVYNTLKQITITIGNVVITLIVGTGVVLYLIAETFHKVGVAASNALIKLLTATQKVVVGAAQALKNDVIQKLTAAGVLLDKGLQFVKQKLTSMKDNIIGVAKWCISQMKQFGFKIYAQILVGASQIKEFGAQIANWVSSQWGTIQDKIGIAWNQAKNMGMQAIQNVKQKVQKGVQQVKQGIKQGVQNVGNKIAKGAGAVTGFVKGIFEYFERLFSFEATDTMGLLRECMKYNGREIIS